MDRRIGVILSYILMVFEVLSTLLLTPYIIRTLGQAEYGVYKLSAAVNAYLLLLDLGVGNAITRYVAKFRAENNLSQGRKFMGIATIFYIIIAAIAIIVGIILVLLFPSIFSTGLTSNEVALGQRLLAITMINSAVTLGTAAYTNAIIAYEHFVISKGSSILQIICRMILTYIVLRIGMGSMGIVVVNLLMTVVCRGFFVVYTLFVIKLKPLFKGIEYSFIKEVIRYSSLIFLQMVATQINGTVDQVLIGALVTASSSILAVYGIGTQIVQYFQSMGSAFNGVLMPGIVRLVELDSSPQKLTEEMIRIGRIIFMMLVIIWMGFLVNGQDFIILWAGQDNQQAYYVAIILMSAQLFILTEMVGSQILWALNQHKEQAILKILIVVLNVFLTIILIKWNPLIGATLGTFISLTLGDILIMNLLFWKKLHINLWRYYRGLLKGVLICAVIAGISGKVVSYFMPDGWIGLIGCISVMVIVYGVTMICFGMNDYEKQLVKSIFYKIRRKE